MAHSCDELIRHFVTQCGRYAPDIQEREELTSAWLGATRPAYIMYRTRHTLAVWLRREVMNKKGLRCKSIAHIQAPIIEVSNSTRMVYP